MAVANDGRRSKIRQAAHVRPKKRPHLPHIPFFRNFWSATSTVVLPVLTLLERDRFRVAVWRPLRLARTRTMVNCIPSRAIWTSAAAQVQAFRVRNAVVTSGICRELSAAEIRLSLSHGHQDIGSNRNRPNGALNRTPIVCESLGASLTP